MYLNNLKFLIEDINIDNNEEEIEDKATVDDGLERDAPATEPQIKQIKKILLTNINNFAKQKIKGSLDEDLGIFTLQNLNSISIIPIIGKMFLSPMQTKGGQKKGTSSFDVMQYKKMQVVPFFLFNKDGENINAQNSKEDYNLLFLMPVIGAKITTDNLKKHEVLFSKEKSKGFEPKDYYETLPNIAYIADIKLTNEELIKTSKAFKTDNTSAIKLPISKKSTRKSTGEQNPKESILRQNIFINEEKNIFNMKKENYRKNIYMNETIIKGSLTDLLFEEKNIAESSLLKEFTNVEGIQGDLVAILANKLKEIGGDEDIEKLASKANIFKELEDKNINDILRVTVTQEIIKIINDENLDSLKKNISGVLFVDNLNKLQEEYFNHLIKNMRNRLSDELETSSSSPPPPQKSSSLPTTHDVKSEDLDAEVDKISSDPDADAKHAEHIKRMRALRDQLRRRRGDVDIQLNFDIEVPDHISVDSITGFSGKFVDDELLETIYSIIDDYQITLLTATALKKYSSLFNSDLARSSGDSSGDIKSDALNLLAKVNKVFALIVKNYLDNAGINSETNPKKCLILISDKIKEINAKNSVFGKVIDGIVSNKSLMTSLKNKKAADRNIRSDIRGKIGNLYKNKIKTDMINKVFDALKGSNNIMIKKIFDKRLDIFGESYVYRNGIKLLLEDNDSLDDEKSSEKSINTKINIDDLFYSVYNEIYDNEQLTIPAYNEKAKFEYFKNNFGMSRERYNDALSKKRRNENGLKAGISDNIVDLKLDIAKVFAYSICSTVLDNEEAFKEKSIEFSGNLKELDKIKINSSGILYSETTYNRLKKENPGASTMSEEELNRMLDDSVKNIIKDICISQHSKYDEDLKKVVLPKIEKWRKADEMSEKDHLKIKRDRTRKESSRRGAGAAAVIGGLIGGPIGAVFGGAAGAVGGYLYGKDSDEETFTSRRQIWLKEPDVIESVDKLFNAISGLAAKIKDVTLESLMLNTNLTKLIFENILLENKEGLSYDDVKKYLSSQKILSFGFPEVINKGEAEASLTEAVCGILEDLFDIKISGVSDAQNTLALSRIGAILDEKAEAGQAASEALAVETSDAGVPQKLDSNMSSMQLLSLLNQSGGDNFIKFIMLFMSQKDEMMKLFDAMDQGKVSGQQAASQISKASGGEMSELENLLQQSIKSMRISLPKIKIDQARKLILTLKNNENQQVINELLSASESIESFNFNPNISKTITDNFNVVEDGHDNIHNIALKLVDSKLINFNFENQIDSEVPVEINLALELVLKGIIESKKVNASDVIGIDVNDAVNVILSRVNRVLEKMKIITKESKQSNDLFVDSLTNYLFEGSKRINTQKRKASYNDPRYLELEMKRIWKL